MSIAKGEKAERFGGIKKGYRGVTAELKKVHWPTKKEIAAYTIVVLVAVFIVGIGIWIVDSGVSFLMNLLIAK